MGGILAGCRAGSWSHGVISGLVLGQVSLSPCSGGGSGSHGAELETTEQGLGLSLAGTRCPSWAGNFSQVTCQEVTQPPWHSQARCPACLSSTNQQPAGIALYRRVNKSSRLEACRPGGMRCTARRRRAGIPQPAGGAASRPQTCTGARRPPPGCGVVACRERPR